MGSLGAATLVAWLVGLGCLVQMARVRGLLRRFRWFVATLIFASVGIGLGSTLLILQTMQMFAGETLIARVTTQRLGDDEFELEYVPLPAPRARQAGVDATALQPIHTRLRGNQWMVSGGIVKWHPWLTVLGLKSYHKPLRLSGQYSDLNQQRTHLPTVHALAPNDRVWEALYWATPYLPFIDATYGSSALVYVEPSTTFEVFVSPTGYLIKRRAGRPGF